VIVAGRDVLGDRLLGRDESAKLVRRQAGELLCREIGSLVVEGANLHVARLLHDDPLRSEKDQRGRPLG